MSEYSTKQKVEILDAADRSGNVSKTADEYGVSRQTIYAWQKKEEELRKEVAKDSEVLKQKAQSLVKQDVLKDIHSYGELLDAKGSLEERKKLLGSKVEYLEAAIIHLIENNPELQDMSPDRQSKVLKTIHDIRQDLYEEPDVIVEYRNNWMELVLQVLRDFMSDNDVRKFAQRMKQVEAAEYEVIE